MERHMKTCRQNEENPRIIFQCSQCPYACANTYFLERHRKHCSSQLAGVTKLSFKCSGCSYTTHSTYYVERHQKYCRRSEKGSNQLKKEKLKQEEGAGNTYACTDCNELFYDEETLASHQLTHAGENPLICRVCNERFFDLDTLTRHVQAHYGDETYPASSNGSGGNGHPGGSSKDGYFKDKVPTETKEETEERFPCPLCGIQFFLKESLTVHLRIHRGEKPFLCLECDIGFAREDYLRRHSRMHHEGKRFQCAECGKKYTDIMYLKQHQRIHKSTPDV